MDFMSKSNEIILNSVNCQSLRAHALDLTASTVQNCNVLILSKTHMPNEELIDIPNFNCIKSFNKRVDEIGELCVAHC